MPKLPSLSNLSLPELDNLIAKADAQKGRIEERRRAKAEAAMIEIQKIVKKAGLTLEEIVALAPKAVKKKKAVKRRAKKVSAKFANPENAKETWTGRGRKPAWVEAALKAGKTLEDLAIGTAKPNSRAQSGADTKDESAKTPARKQPEQAAAPKP